MQLEGRNPVIECLVRAKRQVHKIYMDRGAKPDPRVQRILELAKRRGIQVVPTDRHKLDAMAEGRVHNGVIAKVDNVRVAKTQPLLDELFARGAEPFLVLADELSYEHNLGAILRTSLGFGVDGVVLPTRRGADLSPVVQRVSMGAVEEIPIVRESLFASLKHIRKAGIRVVGADMGGKPASELDLSGPVALVMGAEGRGLSSKLRERCHDIVSIPLRNNLESLNVSVAAAILMYEKRRQDGWFD